VDQAQRRSRAPAAEDRDLIPRILGSHQARDHPTLDEDETEALGLIQSPECRLPLTRVSSALAAELDELAREPVGAGRG
jgi:hypothetical protein